MATLSNPSIVVSTSFFILMILSLGQKFTEAQIGVSYGQIGNDLPSPQDVVNLYKSNGIKAMRLYFPDQATLKALQGSGISVILGVANENIQAIASCQCQANRWVETNVVPYGSFIKYIAVGNEIEPSDPIASSVVKAMQYILNALNSNKLSRIRVSLAINFNLVTNTYPPSNGQFKDTSYMTPIINFLSNSDSPLLVNIYPFFAYVNDPHNVPLDYALFKWPGIKFYDNNGLGYQNLFDAMVDSVYAAISKIVGFGQFGTQSANSTEYNLNVNKAVVRRQKVRVVSSESGWSSSSKGGGFHHFYASLANGGAYSQRPLETIGANLVNAGTYYKNLANHVKQGTPLTPGQPIETYMFAMFDENQKKGDEIERHFGLYYPNQQSKYGQISF